MHLDYAQWMLVSLQKLYLAFVSNCKFTSAKTLPQIRFMENCLVELLSIDPATSYQHGFVYIRQLAVHLRTALTSAKKQAVQVQHKYCIAGNIGGELKIWRFGGLHCTAQLPN